MARTRRALRYRGTRRGGSRDVENGTRKVYVGGQKAKTTAAPKAAAPKAAAPKAAAPKAAAPKAAAPKAAAPKAAAPKAAAPKAAAPKAAAPKPTAPGSNPPTMYFIPLTGKTAAVASVEGSFNALVTAINTIYPSKNNPGAKAIVKTNLGKPRLVDVTFSGKATKAVAVDITGLPTSVTDSSLQTASIFSKIPGNDKLRQTYSAPPPAQIVIASAQTKTTAPAAPKTATPAAPKTATPKAAAPAAPKTAAPQVQPVPLAPSAEIRAVPGQPIRLAPGDYKGMLSAGKYTIYKDVARGQQAANVMIKMTPQGDYGLFRVVGTPEQIEKGITELRGKPVLSGIKGLIRAIEEEIADDNRQVSAMREQIGDLNDSLASNSLSERGIQLVREQIAQIQKKITEIENSRADDLARLQAAKTALTQEQVRAGLPAATQ